MNRGIDADGVGRGDRKGDCEWCNAPAYDRIYAVGKPGNKGAKLALVCDEHLAHFRRQGLVSERDHFDAQYAKGKRR